MADPKNPPRGAGAVALLVGLDDQFLSFWGQLRALGFYDPASPAVLAPAARRASTVLAKADEVAAATFRTGFDTDDHVA